MRVSAVVVVGLVVVVGGREDLVVEGGGGESMSISWEVMVGGLGCFSVGGFGESEWEMVLLEWRG